MRYDRMNFKPIGSEAQINEARLYPKGNTVVYTSSEGTFKNNGLTGPNFFLKS